MRDLSVTVIIFVFMTYFCNVIAYHNSRYKLNWEYDKTKADLKHLFLLNTIAIAGAFGVSSAFLTVQLFQVFFRTTNFFLLFPFFISLSCLIMFFLAQAVRQGSASGLVLGEKRFEMRLIEFFRINHHLILKKGGGHG